MIRSLFSVIRAASAVAAALLSPAAAGAQGLAVASMAGQRVPVLPATMMVAEPPADEWLPGDRAARLRWADSVMGEVLLDRAPEVEWVLPPELRRLARRAPGTVADPDRMGQAVLRADRLDRVPDPLRSYLRSLAAISDSRVVLVPAAIHLAPDSTGGAMRGEIVLVLADSRNGNILWRGRTFAIGQSPSAAMRAALASILPALD